jgi:hypothetical protein
METRAVVIAAGDGLRKFDYQNCGRCADFRQAVDWGEFSPIRICDRSAGLWRLAVNIVAAGHPSARRSL